MFGGAKNPCLSRGNATNAGRGREGGAARRVFASGLPRAEAREVLWVWARRRIAGAFRCAPHALFAHLVRRGEGLEKARKPPVLTGRGGRRSRPLRRGGARRHA